MNDTRARMRVGGLLGALLVLAGAQTLHAQINPREFLMSARADYQTYAESSALRPAPSVAIEATYFLTSNFGLGFQATAARPWTKGEYFPLSRHTFWTVGSANDTTLLYVLNQQLTALDFGLQGEYRHAFDRIEPFVQLGVGRYMFYLDRRSQPQSDRSRRFFNGMAYSAGVGVSVVVAEGARVMLAASDRIFTDYDRDNLSLTDRLLTEDRFRNPDPAPPAKEDVIHNLRFSIGFSFIPGRTQ
jgi:hypothetical protein